MCVIKKIAHIFIFGRIFMLYLLIILAIMISFSLYFEYKDELFCRKLTTDLQEINNDTFTFNEFTITILKYSNTIIFSCYVNNIISPNNLIAYWEYTNKKLCNFKIQDSKSFKLMKNTYNSLNDK